MAKFKNTLILTLKGMAMGAADVVPGVSGGTIAFVTGIYEELLSSISALNLSALKCLKKEGFQAFWKKINGRFLITLLTGILVSIGSLSMIIKYLLENEPIKLWSFFFGLVLASVFLVGKKVKSWNYQKVLGLIAGTLIAYYVTIASPSSGTESLWYIFLCGMIAITAMILPGISGSFILLLLGAYTTVLGSVSSSISALKDMDIPALTQNALLLFIFALGCLIGLLSFSRLLNWMFSKAHDLTVAVLSGFLIGSLNKIWPWKNTLEWFTKHAGEANEQKIALVEENVSPQHFSLLSGLPNELGAALLFCLLGIGLIFLLDRFAPKTEA